MTSIAEPGLIDTQRPKALGAYYTDAQVADFLVAWAVRSKHDHVLDPSFGGGVFLRAAAKRIRALRGDPEHQVWGVEIDESAHRRIGGKLADELRARPDRLLLSDFFAVTEKTLRAVDVVVGNPPFIRYHRFTGAVRSRALNACATAGIRVSELSSSWVPFLIHSVSMLKPGGRLAMVVPAEIGHAAYARVLLEHLRHSFAAVTLLSFRKPLFPDLSEGTLLLLADNHGPHKARFMWRELQNADMLRDLLTLDFRILDARPLDAAGIAAGQERLAEHFIPSIARDLYRELRAACSVRRLGELADVGIGYVTGANDYFHVRWSTAAEYRIPRRCLRKAARRGRALSGLRFTERDWLNADPSYLVHLSAEGEVTLGVKRFLDAGIAKGVHLAYKCRTRSPWYRVPHVHVPDALLTYMSGAAPRLVANDMGAVAPNTLHILRLRDDARLAAHTLAALWQTSLSRLSAEIEGHALGGGMLKLEPTEAESVLVACPDRSDGIGDVANQLDVLIRAGRQLEAQRLADTEILVKRVGLSRSDCRHLASSAELLRDRRHHWRTE